MCSSYRRRQSARAGGCKIRAGRSGLQECVGEYAGETTSVIMRVSRAAAREVRSRSQCSKVNKREARVLASSVRVVAALSNKRAAAKTLLTPPPSRPLLARDPSINREVGLVVSHVSLPCDARSRLRYHKIHSHHVDRVPEEPHHIRASLTRCPNPQAILLGCWGLMNRRVVFLLPDN